MLGSSPDPWLWLKISVPRKGPVFFQGNLFVFGFVRLRSWLPLRMNREAKRRTDSLILPPHTTFIPRLQRMVFGRNGRYSPVDFTG